ncbi:MAG: NADP-dependent oxidoreductase [Candidatus Nanopelagicales bacterium]
MARSVQYEQFGGPEVLEVVEVPEPSAGPGQIRVRVKAAALNPVDYKIFHGGLVANAFGVVPPAGVGNDFSGVIDQVGEDVVGWAVGDEVFGSASDTMADYVVVPAAAPFRKPAGLSWEVAGSLGVVGPAASASVASLHLTESDTVLVSAAAGGVGVLAAQLALATGAKVIGTASEANHEFLSSLGVVPVAYGEGLVDRLRAAAPQGLTAVLDNHGLEAVEAGLELGVPPGRINTIASYNGPEGINFVGGMNASRQDLEVLANLIAEGGLQLPIDSVFPLESAGEAFARLEAGHVRGKVVLTTG